MSVFAYLLAFFLGAQLRIPIRPLRKPFEIGVVDPRREKKLTAGLLKSVPPCTLFNDEICA